MKNRKSEVLLVKPIYFTYYAKGKRLKLSVIQLFLHIKQLITKRVANNIK